MGTCKGCKWWTRNPARPKMCAWAVSYMGQFPPENFDCGGWRAALIEFEATIDTRPGSTGSYLLWASHSIPYGKYKVTLEPTE